ncbi:MAG: hypothetical protein LUG83_10945 [Lachnospiraceae bacterium]|nr:hypothetical protein [Lachnospiraceae bacterium]
MKNRSSIPKPESDRINADEVKRMQNHYNEMETGKYKFQRFFFSIVFNFDKSLFAVLSGAATGYGASTLSNLLNVDNLNTVEEAVMQFIRFVFSAGFTVSLILFFADIIKAQESGSNYIKSESYHVSVKDIRKERDTLVYQCCLNSIRKLEITFCMSAIFAVLMVVSYLFGFIILERIEVAVQWAISQVMKYTGL